MRGTLLYDPGDFLEEARRPMRNCDDSSAFARPSKSRDCACNALSPNTLHYGERCTACPFAIRKEELKGGSHSFRQRLERRAA